MSQMKRVVRSFANNPTDLISLDGLEARLAGGSEPAIKRKTIRKYLERLQHDGIIERIRGEDGDIFYRCRSVPYAISYLEGRQEHVAGRMAPRTSPMRPQGTVVHRVTAKFQLDGAELEKVKRIGVLKKFGATPAYYHIVNDAFKLKVWTSGKAQIFVMGDWYNPLAQSIGQGAVDKVSLKLRRGEGHEGVARPDLPVNRPIRVLGSKGVTVFQYGYSQIPEGEFDRHGPQDDPVANRVENWVYDDTKFRADVSNEFVRLENRLSELTSKLDLIPGAVGEAVKRALEEVVNGPKAQYTAKERAKDDLMYG